MTQPEIARLETGKVSPTWNTAMTLLHAVDARLEIKIRRHGRPAGAGVPGRPVSV